MLCLNFLWNTYGSHKENSRVIWGFLENNHLWKQNRPFNVLFWLRSIKRPWNREIIAAPRTNCQTPSAQHGLSITAPRGDKHTACLWDWAGLQCLRDTWEIQPCFQMATPARHSPKTRITWGWLSLISSLLPRVIIYFCKEIQEIGKALDSIR